MSGRRSAWVPALVVVALLATIVIFTYWFFAIRTVVAHYSDSMERFEYGSIGSEYDSLPYPVWQALPDVCPDKLPGGYAAVGILYQSGHEQPIGISRRVVGVERMGVNCALCHVGAVRSAPGAPLQIIAGMPNHQFDLQRYAGFVLGCVADPRFTVDNVLAAMRKHRPVSTTDALVYRFIALPLGQRRAAQKAKEYAWFSGRPEFGPGRLDTPNSLRRMLGLDIAKDLIGTVDYPSVWNQAARTNQFRHWDANSPSLRERDHMSAAIAGATPEVVDRSELDWVEGWLQHVEPPKYPFQIDQEAARRGEEIFKGQCAECHVRRAGDVTSLPVIGTDRARLDVFSADLLTALNAFGGGREAAHYRKTDGYNNVLLDGVWARAPYLHNGSVPTLRDLLEPPDRRPKVFYTGSDLYDQGRLGFVSSSDAGSGAAFRFDTSLPGNGNGGHDYGTALGDDEKRNLLEFLKTL